MTPEDSTPMPPPPKPDPEPNPDPGSNITEASQLRAQVPKQLPSTINPNTQDILNGLADYTDKKITESILNVLKTPI